MSDLPFTARQERALSADRLLSVVAGAGTGKTAVLTERYVRILENLLDPDTADGQVAARPDQIVAVTFTRKAAKQMREKIRDKITDRVKAARTQHQEASVAGDEEAQTAGKRALRHWTHMRRLISEAPITTIDGLANLIVREFGIEFGLDPDSAILDTVDEELMRDQAARRVLGNPPDDARAALRQLHRMQDGRSVVLTLKQLLAERAHADRWAAHIRTHEPDEIFHSLAATLVAFDEQTADDVLQRLGRILAPLAALPDDPDNDDARNTSIRIAKAFQAAPRDDLLDKAGAIWPVLEHFTSRSGPAKLYTAPHTAFGKQALWADQGGGDFTKAVLFDLNTVFEPLVDTFHGVPGKPDRDLLHMMRGLASAYEAARTHMSREKEQRGVLDFHDIAENALRILERNSLAEDLRQRWRHIMVDEFQDTNGMQWAILSRLGAAPLAPPPADDDEDDEDAFQTAAAHFGLEPDHAAGALAALGIDHVGDHHTAPDIPGKADTTDRADSTDASSPDPLGRDRLFIVGDAKQSIYAFRGAEVDVYQASRHEIRAANERHGRGDDALPVRNPPKPSDEHAHEHERERLGEVNLDRNFRSLPNVVACLNHLFDRVLAPDGNAARPDEAEPGPLVAHRDQDTCGPGTVEVVAAPHRIQAAVDAGLVSQMLGERIDRGTYTSHQLAQHLIGFVERTDRLVYDQTGKEPRAPRYGDVAILIPARTRLGALTSALRAHGIPYIVHGGRGFWTRQEVWDLVNALAFIADPRRHIELVGILRSPLFGWTDDAILRLVHHNPKRPMDALHAAIDDPALLGPTRDQCAIDAATTWHHLSTWQDAAPALPAAQLLVRILDDSAYLAAFADHPEARRVLANVHKLVELVRDLERHRALPLAALVRRIERLIDDEHDEGEADPEVDDEHNAVHIMTIHAAKGLEFPIVYATELGAELGKGRGRGADLARGTIQSHFMLTSKVLGDNGERTEPLLHKVVKREQKQRERAESKRLLYVALTRARDHLILHGTTKRLLDTNDPTPRPIVDGTSWMEWIEHAIGIDADTYTDVRENGSVQIQVGHGTLHVTAPTPTFDPDALPRAHIEQPKRDEAPQLEHLPRPTSQPPIHIAPSGLETLAVCTARFRYQVIERLPDRALRGVQARQLQRGTVFGTLVHRAIAEGQTNGIDDPALHAKVRGLAERLGDAPENLSTLVDPHVARAHHILGDTSDTLRELGIDVPLGPHARVRGTLDMLRPLPTPHVIDHKTDTVHGKGDDRLLAHARTQGHDRQVALYARALGHDATASLAYTGPGRRIHIDASNTINDLVERIERDRAARGAAHDAPTLDPLLDDVWPRDPADPATCDTCPYFQEHGGPCVGKGDPSA